MRYRLHWTIENQQTWTGLVEADSEEEALQKCRKGEYMGEELVASNDFARYGEKIEGVENEPLKTGYCVRCRAISEMVSVETLQLKNGAFALSGSCIICNKEIFRILKGE